MRGQDLDGGDKVVMGRSPVPRTRENPAGGGGGGGCEFESIFQHAKCIPSDGTTSMCAQ